MPTSEIFLLSGMAAVTFAIRYILIGMSGRLRLSAIVLQALRYVPPVVLTAIVVPLVLMPDGAHLTVSYRNPQLIGAIAAILIGYWCKNLLLTIVVGMATFLLWKGALGGF